MKDEEKNLIENLFNRLKNAELNSSERDESADKLIQSLVQKQPASSYYMAQTILVQETHIKKMNAKIEELNKKIEILTREGTDKKPSFLSNFFKKNNISSSASYDNNIWKNKETVLPSQNPNINMSTPMTYQGSPTVTNARNSSFLSNALQTATGVAGGMILGNMLMNVFNHSKSEEESFDNINTSSFDHHTHENLVNSNNNNLVNNEEKESEISDMHVSNVDTTDQSTNNDMHNIDYLDDNNDINDENFI